MKNPQELDISLKFVFVGEIQNENGKKKVTSIESYSKTDLEAEGDLANLVKENISALWNSKERVARNKKPFPVVVRASYQKVGRE
ncbi:MAG: hypothetical protein NUV67_06060 [archaeon]|nr:hypothetical protein [archaeon]